MLSLGEEGEIILEFTTNLGRFGVDLLVFENFPWWELGIVGVSNAARRGLVDLRGDDPDLTGCAGVNPASHPDNCVDATDPDVAVGG